jgi:hypothetical protein
LRQEKKSHYEQKEREKKKAKGYIYTRANKKNASKERKTKEQNAMMM